MSNISIVELLEAGAHFGHKTSNWNPKMTPYIFGKRNKIHIINLDKTLPLFKDALNFISSLAAKRGKILFVGTKMQARDIIKEEATRCGMPYVNHRWLGGMLTNYKTIRQSIKRFKELDEMRNSPIFSKLTKKEALLIDRELSKLEQNLGGIKNMNGLPDAIFVIDVGHEKTAINEAKRLRIPIIAVVDTNCNPDGINYVIPGNDDAGRAIKLYVENIADTIIAARGNIVEEEIIEEKEEKFAKKPANNKKKVFTKKTNLAGEEKPAEALAEKAKKAAVKKKPATLQKKPSIIIKSTKPKVAVTNAPKAEKIEVAAAAEPATDEGAKNSEAK
jgi:small subunit ribosomal protein S2